MKLYDYIYEIDNSYEWISFGGISGVSILGDVLSGADNHPVQYRAFSTTPPGVDDPFEGIGWTPTEAVRNLAKVLRKHYKNY